MFDFSIIIPTKNEEKNILSCLNSIFCQTQKNIEIVIIDSFSKDKTISLVKKYLKIKKEKILN